MRCTGSRCSCPSSRYSVRWPWRWCCTSPRVTFWAWARRSVRPPERASPSVRCSPSFSWSQQLFQPIQDLADMFNNLQAAMASSRAYLRRARHQGGGRRQAGCQAADRTSRGGGLRGRVVLLRPDRDGRQPADDDRWILRGIDLHMRPARAWRWWARRERARPASRPGQPLLRRAARAVKVDGVGRARPRPARPAAARRGGAAGRGSVRRNHRART